MKVLGKRLIYIYDDFEDSYNDNLAVCDDMIGIRDDGYISAALGFNPYKDKDVVTRKAMTAHYFTSKVDDWMKTMKFFKDKFE